MKKIIAFILTALFLAVFVCGCKSEYRRKYVSRVLDTDLTDGVLVFESDSHSGFHGDGVLNVCIKLGNDIQLNENWHSLPLGDELNKLLYDKDGFNFALNYGIPDVENGFYFFDDRFEGDEDKGENILNRGAFNFTYAVYDADSNTVYFLKVDT